MCRFQTFYFKNETGVDIDNFINFSKTKYRFKCSVYNNIINFKHLTQNDI